jgi:hypothetical protein
MNGIIHLSTAVQAAFNSLHRQHEPICLQDTRVEVLQEIRNWMQDNDTRRIFWLNGLAGTGKSTIARTIARECYDTGYLGASFFFTRGGGDLARASKFVPTIAMQLATQIPSLRKHLSASLEKHQDVTNLSLTDQWKHLIVEPLINLESHLQRVRLLIVVDALDECDGDDDVRAILRLFSEIQRIRAIQLCVFITSRPETPIRLGFDKISSILHHDLVLNSVSRDIVDQDIRTFFKTQFSEISKEFKGISSDWPGPEKINALVEKSDGLFIYAATVCRFIKTHDQWSPKDLLEIFIPASNASTDRPSKPRRKQATPKKSPFSELDEIYTHILERPLHRIRDLRDKEEIASEVREIISTIAILFQPQPLPTLSCILDLDQVTIQLRLKHLGAVLSIPADDSSAIRTLHPSFRDFLFDNQRCINHHFRSNELADHSRLSELCLDILSKHLKEDICDVQRSGVTLLSIDKSRIEKAIPPEVEYACTYWLQHLLQSEIELDDDHQIHQFLKHQILHWFEALSWIGRLSDGIYALSALELRISVSQLICIWVTLSNKY